MRDYNRVCLEIANTINDLSNPDHATLKRIIKEISGRYSLPTLPKNSDILEYVSNKKVKELLTVKPARSASGVLTFAIMAKPYACPHGRCIYCPGGIEINTPNSYTLRGPTTRHALAHNYDPYMQIQSKLRYLNKNGHNINKIELIIIGGTFLFQPRDYQYEFIKSCYDALNGFKASNLEEAKRINERATSRNVGLTIETKPDYCKEEHIDLMLEYGATRVEIGVQSLRNEVYSLVNRGHTLDDVIEAFKIARDAGYKIAVHMMPGLPGSSPEKDYEDFVTLFNDERFKPDMLKIYPTLVIEGTGLHELYKRSAYRAYSDEEMLDLLVNVKSIIPKWVRIMRLQREIASDEIIAGPKNGNLRQMVFERLKRRGLRCKCIRCREIGLKRINESNVRLLEERYRASDGEEVFLSYEDRDTEALLGFLRLRHPSEKAHRKEVKDCCIVREVHVYGRALNLGEREDSSSQHRGYGVKLMQEAERVAHEYGVKKILVISAVGTREYYRRLGYELEGPYMAKPIRMI